MKKYIFIIFSIFFLCLGFARVSFASQIWGENFESLSDGFLNGQNSWTAGSDEVITSSTLLGNKDWWYKNSALTETSHTFTAQSSAYVSFVILPDASLGTSMALYGFSGSNNRMILRIGNYSGSYDDKVYINTGGCTFGDSGKTFNRGTKYWFLMQFNSTQYRYRMDTATTTGSWSSYYDLCSTGNIDKLYFTGDGINGNQGQTYLDNVSVDDTEPANPISEGGGSSDPWPEGAIAMSFPWANATTSPNFNWRVRIVVNTTDTLQVFPWVSYGQSTNTMNYTDVPIGNFFYLSGYDNSYQIIQNTGVHQMGANNGDWYVQAHAIVGDDYSHQLDSGIYLFHVQNGHIIQIAEVPGLNATSTPQQQQAANQLLDEANPPSFRNTGGGLIVGSSTPHDYLTLCNIQLEGLTRTETFGMKSTCPESTLDQATYLERLTYMISNTPMLNIFLRFNDIIKGKISVSGTIMTQESTFRTQYGNLCTTLPFFSSTTSVCVMTSSTPQILLDSNTLTFWSKFQKLFLGLSVPVWTYVLYFLI